VEVLSDTAMEVEDDEDGDEEERKTIPPELVTRLLHEFFENKGTRLSREANAAVARYMDVFAREAIARAAAERDGGFLEVSSIDEVR
jgi:centromere protein X